MAVSQNLALALRYLRSRDQVRTLWIDAICINQEDTDERSEQVGRMSDIYKLADKVIAWLGPSSTGGSVAMTTLDHLGCQVEFTRDSYYLPPPTHYSVGFSPIVKNLRYDDGIW